MKINTIVFSFGRVNPPTAGHEVLAEKILAVANAIGEDSVATHLFISHKHGHRDNPLTPEQRIEYWRDAFRYDEYIANLIEYNETAKCVISAVEVLRARYPKAKNLVFVGGDDTAANIGERIRAVNNAGTADFRFQGIFDVSVVRGKYGVSGTMVREMIREGWNPESVGLFTAGIPTKEALSALQQRVINF